jgi:acetyl esterase
MLDPQARALIDLMIEKGVPPTHTLTPAQARAFYRDRRAFTQPEPPAMAEVRELHAGEVPLRLYRPAGTQGTDVLPVLVYFHGGGWTIGDLDTHDVLCRQLAQASGAAVVSVDYRLGPEQRFPAAVDDCVAATRWVREQARDLALDASRLAVGGDSAGGNLAAVVCLVLREAGEPLPAFQLLIYPATDMRAVAPSHTSNGQGYLLTRDSIAYYRGHYLADAAQWTDWRASPLLAPDHRGLPPARRGSALRQRAVGRRRARAVRVLRAPDPRLHHDGAAAGGGKHGGGALRGGVAPGLAGLSTRAPDGPGAAGWRDGLLRLPMDRRYCMPIQYLRGTFS